MVLLVQDREGEVSGGRGGGKTKEEKKMTSESVPEVENVGGPILMKLSSEVGLTEIFQKSKLVLFSYFYFKRFRGLSFGASGTVKILLQKG